jgi:hypothetical protein
VEVEPLPSTGRAVGVDLGLIHLATLYLTIWRNHTSEARIAREARSSVELVAAVIARRLRRRSSHAITPVQMRLLAATSVDALRKRVRHHRDRLPPAARPSRHRERDHAHERSSWQAPQLSRPGTRTAALDLSCRSARRAAPTPLSSLRSWEGGADWMTHGGGPPAA